MRRRWIWLAVVVVQLTAALYPSRGPAVSRTLLAYKDGIDHNRSDVCISVGAVPWLIVMPPTDESGYYSHWRVFKFSSDRLAFYVWFICSSAVILAVLLYRPPRRTTQSAFR